MKAFAPCLAVILLGISIVPAYCAQTLPVHRVAVDAADPSSLRVAMAAHERKSNAQWNTKRNTSGRGRND